jgi:hypothetical protein
MYIHKYISTYAHTWSAKVCSFSGTGELKYFVALRIVLAGDLVCVHDMHGREKSRFENLQASIESNFYLLIEFLPSS